MNQRLFELRAALIFLVTLLLLLGSYTQEKYDENRALKSSLKIFETSLEQERQKNLLQLDSLEQIILRQDQLHLQLRDSLATLHSHRTHLNTKSDENKAAITRIHDVDSLYHLVARHYHQ